MNRVICGLGFGDEAKGLATSYLCSKTKNPIVVRFNGGPQCGHTVKFNDIHHVFSNFGSGSPQGIPTYWSQYCPFNPTSFLNEYYILKEKGINPVIMVNPLCPIITPYDIVDNQREAKASGHGSVGVGFGKTLERHEKYFKLYVQDLFYPQVLEAKLTNIEKQYYKFDINIKIIHDFLEDCDEAINLIKICQYEDLTFYYKIFEGGQGILLDQDFGFFPNVTRSNTTSKNVFQIDPYGIEEIIYVTRTYQTRHGNGYMSNECKLDLKNNEHETNVTNEFQGIFRTGVLDTQLMNYALKCDKHFSKDTNKSLFISCMDQYEINVDDLLSKLDCDFKNVYVSYGPSLDDVIDDK